MLAAVFFWSQRGSFFELSYKMPRIVISELRGDLADRQIGRAQKKLCLICAHVGEILRKAEIGDLVKESAKIRGRISEFVCKVFKRRVLSYVFVDFAAHVVNISYVQRRD